MNRFFSVVVLFCAAFVVMASPVRRGQWQMVTLADGSTVRAEARGDETMLYWQSADGRCYVRDGHTDRYRKVSLESLKRNAASPATRASGLRRMRAQALRKNSMQPDRLNGKKHGLVILVDFSGKGFSRPDPGGYYDKLFNPKDDGEYGFNGSVHDYFRMQSHGKFDITFDVVGPVTMPRPFSYYGRNDEEMTGEMVHDACVAVDGEVDFSKYDWDGDREVDMVYIIYAGYGQADHSDDDDYIWPHMYKLSYHSYYQNTKLKLDGTVIDTYACSNELDPDDNPVGIGTVCHEFSHCLGLPDMYDTVGNTNFGMGSWDLMDYGCYNDNGYTPAGYTGYEKMMLGWSTPVELKAPVEVTAMQPASKMGGSYIVYNPDNRHEYYVLDNRQQQGFDEALPGHGMIIIHVDYDATMWEYNIVNATAYDSYSGLTNTHQRATIYHADNDDGTNTEAGDAYPYQGNDSLSGTSVPASKWYNAGYGDAGQKKFGLFAIRENNDGTMGFHFMEDAVQTSGDATVPEDGPHVLLRETFDRCSGSGGNDGKFKGSVASAKIHTDLEGWTYDFGYGGDRCARFGGRYAGTGMVTSPAFTLRGDTVSLTFRAAGWDTKDDGDKLLLSLSGGNATFVESKSTDMGLTMVRGAWSTYTMRIVGEGVTRLTFTPGRRFFLDDVVVTGLVTSGMTGSGSRTAKVCTGRIYSIDGKFVGTDFNALPRGIYIMDGRKTVK